MDAIAASAGVSRAYFTRLVKLSFLAPDITKAILEGRHPIDLTASRLINHPRLPLGLESATHGLGLHLTPPRLR